MNSRPLLYAVYFIYFFCGLTQCFEGVFLPEFKEYFRLSYQQQMYTMFAKNIPFVAAVAIGYFIVHIGYKNCLTIAMFLYAAGTLLLVPGLKTSNYGIVLAGFFLIGLGFNFQLVSGNPLLCVLGPESGSASRLNLGNALGAVAQIIAPAMLSLMIPATAGVVAKLPYMMALFKALAVVLLVTGFATLRVREPQTSISASSSASELPTKRAPGIWNSRRVMFGFVVIFLCLGVEAGYFALFRNYLEDPVVAGLTSRQSQQLFTVFLAVFALGRLGASFIQKRLSPSTHLMVHLVLSAFCLVLVMTARGWLAIAAILILGFWVSIIFPTLYALAIEGCGERAGQASGLLTMGFLGAAVLPVLQGRLADSIGLQHSFLLGVGAYAAAMVFTAMFSKTGAVKAVGQLRSSETR